VNIFKKTFGQNTLYSTQQEREVFVDDDDDVGQFFVSQSSLLLLRWRDSQRHGLPICRVHDEAVIGVGERCRNGCDRIEESSHNHDPFTLSYPQC